MSGVVRGKCFTEVRKGRLRKLIKHLEWVLKKCPETFDLKSWFEGETEEDIRSACKKWPKYAKKGKALNCNTTACLVGNLPLVFPKKFEWVPTIGDLCSMEVENEFALPVNAWQLYEFFGGNENFWATIIHQHSAMWSDLFKKGKSAKLGHVIYRLKELLKEGENWRWKPGKYDSE
jgi:hypothetical protein